MLGLARASEYAKWWSSGNATATLSTSLTTTSTLAQQFMVSPRYYADLTGSTNNTTVNPITMSSTSGSSMDMTGVVNEPKRQVRAMTFRIGTNWLTTATTGNQVGLIYFNNMSNNGTGNFYGCSLRRINGDYFIGATQFANTTWTAGQLSPYRNRWLALICASSDSSSTFANWSGGGTNTYGWAGRSILYDIEANTIIDQNDSYGNEAVGTVDLTQAWTFGNGTSSYYNHPYFYTDTNNLYYRSDVNVASGWFAIGETLDPLTYYTQLAGSGIGSTVGGIKAWSVFAVDGAGTAGTDTKTEDIGTWGGARMPNATVAVVCNTGETVPTFTSF